MLAIGQNDFAPWTAVYEGIYNGTWIQQEISDYVSQVSDNISLALTELASAGNVVVSNVIDFGIAPLTRGFRQDAAFAIANIARGRPHQEGDLMLLLKL